MFHKNFVMIEGSEDGPLKEGGKQELARSWELRYTYGFLERLHSFSHQASTSE